MEKKEKNFKRGALTDGWNQEIYFSDRGIPLLTQSVTSVTGEPRKMLTVENHNKWYKMFIIHEDGTVEPRHEMVTNQPDAGEGYGWMDHNIIPFAFHETALNLGLLYDSLTFAFVCEQFVSDCLDGDWCKLGPYLPTEPLIHEE